MPEAGALKVALQLLHMPSHARMARSQPLPPDVLLLLRIAANDPDAIRDAMAESGRDRSVIERAAGFFIEQVLWHPQADSYRILGASPGASPADLKRNMSLLMTWLHPDIEPRDERAVFVLRVTSAWNDLKTPDRRESYAAALKQAASLNGGHRKYRPQDAVQRQRQRRHLSAALHAQHLAPQGRPRFLHRLLSFLLGSPHR